MCKSQAAQRIGVVIPVYLPGAREAEALSRLVELASVSPVISEINLVNDSAEPLPQGYLKTASGNSICKIVNRDRNYGRSSAINEGVDEASTSLVWIMDADCWPRHKDVALLETINWEDTDAVIGTVESTEADSFWARYQKERRAKNRTVSTANMVIRKQLFLEIGGFDSAYRWYGFEDQDFIARLPRSARVRVDSGFNIEHYSELSLDEIRKKMYFAAFSGKLYSTKFPAKYREMGYSKVDYEFTGTLSRYALSILALIETIAYPIIDKGIRSKSVPYFVKAKLALFVSAISYYKGSRGRREERL